MTMMFTISIDDVEDRSFRARLHLRNIDAWHLPRQPEFPVQILMEAWSLMVRGHSFQKAPFSREEGVEIVNASPANEEYAELYNAFMGGKAWTTSDGWLLDETRKRPREPKIQAKDFYRDQLDPYGGAGMSKGVHYISLASNPQRFADLTKNIVVDYTMGEARNIPADADFEDLSESEAIALLNKPLAERPYAEFTTEVSDIRFLQHLRPGLRWQTAFTGLLPR